MKMKTMMLAIAGLALAEMGLEAQAADVTVIDSSSSPIHPYFKSNCWSADMKANNPDPKQWVFFGGIGARSQFTWGPFEDLLNPKCKHPKVSFTYVLDGEAPPVPGKVPKARKATLDFDPTVPAYTITINDIPVITGVTPADDDNDDDD
ncbi:MAG TPA: hypothetical protein VKR38_04500 [Usitatibacter sp.]|nr:hypothetical protein [Usitatibacter sp.]